MIEYDKDGKVVWPFPSSLQKKEVVRPYVNITIKPKKDSK